MLSDQTPSGYPLIPPQEAERVFRLCLLRSHRVGVATYRRLMAEHGSAAAALQALPGIAAAAGVTDYRPFSERSAQAELAAGARLRARLICDDDAEYPAALREISDAPPLLWVRGRVDLLAKPMLALVGARNASSLGARMARGLAAELGQKGFVIASGLARGIDTAAHMAALDTGTVAVLAGGVDVIYPSENSKLAEDIAGQGCLISEAPIGLAPQARHFPARNRIISGLSRATIVVEAAARSGSLITARTALDQGRDVMAVPGHPFDARASGCNILLRDGAVLVRGADDVIEALGPDTGSAPVVQPRDPSETKTPAVPPATVALHQRILDRLGPSPLAEDQLIRDMGLPARAITPALTDLELRGQVRRQSGGLLARAG